jgi:hypothetical protein
MGLRSAVSTRKGGGFFGFKLDAIACSQTGLPLAWRIESGNRQETLYGLALIDAVRARGFAVESCAFDKGYTTTRTTQAARRAAAARSSHFARSARPSRLSASTAAGRSRADFKRGASKWRCPTSECEPKSRWIKPNRVHTLIPRESKRWKELYVDVRRSSASSDA